MYHNAVLFKNIIDNLGIEKGKIYVDATLGGGSITLGIANKLQTGTVIGFDVDINAIENFSNKGLQIINPFHFKLKDVDIYLINANFRKIASELTKIGINHVDGVVYDLGVSSFQIDNPNMGFSYKAESLLDMRMDKNLKVTAQDLLMVMYKNELEDMFKKYSDEPFAHTIALNIVKERKKKKIQSSLQLVEIVKSSIRNQTYLYRHVARVFQALRIAVNDELGALNDSLLQLPTLIAYGGRVEIVTFHSIEDRKVKSFFKENTDKFRSLYNNIVYPSDVEINENIRSRSAKLRIYEKI